MQAATEYAPYNQKCETRCRKIKSHAACGGASTGSGSSREDGEGNQLCAAPSSGAGAEHRCRSREKAEQANRPCSPPLRSPGQLQSTGTPPPAPEDVYQTGCSHSLLLFVIPRKNISDTPGAPFKVLKIAAGADW